jgi:FHA domain
MDVSLARLVPGPGADGWLARLPGAVVWVPASGQDAGELISACLAAISPTDLLGRVGSRLADPQAATWPPFAIVAARGLELVAVVHGPVELIADQDGEQKRLYGGEDVGSWLNRLLKDARSLRAGTVGSDEGLADLREGVIRASGFVLVPPGLSTALRQTSYQPKEQTSYQPKETVQEVRGVREVPVAEADSPTVVDRPTLEPADDVTIADQGELDTGLLATGAEVVSALPEQLVMSREVLVLGVCCPRDHLNDPRDDFCRVCGLPLVPGASEVEGPRPPLGRLTWDNGEVHELLGAALVGRDVGLDGAVMSGELAALVPAGQNDSMSRVHAELRPDGWDVVVIDRGSTNGTFIWDEPSKAWQRLPPDEPHVVRPGSVLAFGERTATFESVPVTAS